MSAIFNCRPRCKRCFWWLVAILGLAGFASTLLLAAVEGEPARRAREEFTVARTRYQADPTNNIVAGEFVRVVFDCAEFSTNHAERAALADLGITACRKLVARDPQSATGHYYLAMNLGQLARTKSIGALKIVDEMEREFHAARKLDQLQDFAGPDRNLGLLYLQAPSIGSIGNRSKARQHLQRAVLLSPKYPGNRLNLAEAYLGWSDFKDARREIESLETLWPEARTNLTGAAWSETWTEWDARFMKAKKKLKEGERPATSPKGRD